MKIRSVVAQLFRANGQTNSQMIKLMVTHRNSEIAPKNGFQLLLNPQKGIDFTTGL